jgi:polyisoprenoid-binding protein YceI
MVGYSRTALRAGSVLAMILWVGGAAAAAAAPPPHYTLDAGRSLFRFSFVQAGANNTGRFTKFGSDVLFAADNLAGSKIDVTVDLAGLDTGDKERDDTLKGVDLFNVAKFPQAHFVATKITSGAGGRFDAKGKLTMHGVTKDLTVPVTFQTKVEQGKTIGYMTGHITLKRLDYGVGQGDWKSTEWVNDDVNVTFSLRLVPAAT